MTLHYNTLHRYIHAPGTQIEVIWGSNYRLLVIRPILSPFKTHAKENIIPRFLTILSPYPKVSQWHHFWSDPWIPRWRPAWRRAARAAGASSASCAVRTPSAWPPAAMITGIPWNLRRAARTAMGPWGKKTPLESEDLKKSDGFQVEHVFFSGCCWCFLLWFLERVLFFSVWQLVCWLRDGGSSAFWPTWAAWNFLTGCSKAIVNQIIFTFGWIPILVASIQHHC